jgi:hypothetical protein
LTYNDRGGDREYGRIVYAVPEIVRGATRYRLVARVPSARRAVTGEGTFLTFVTFIGRLISKVTKVKSVPREVFR